MVLVSSVRCWALLFVFFLRHSSHNRHHNRHAITHEFKDHDDDDEGVAYPLPAARYGATLCLRIREYLKLSTSIASLFCEHRTHLQPPPPPPPTVIYTNNTPHCCFAYFVSLRSSEVAPVVLLVSMYVIPGTYLVGGVYVLLRAWLTIPHFSLVPGT